jgi:hypothetical protein
MNTSQAVSVFQAKNRNSKDIIQRLMFWHRFLSMIYKISAKVLKMGGKTIKKNKIIEIK